MNERFSTKSNRRYHGQIKEIPRGTVPDHKRESGACRTVFELCN